MFKKSAFFLLKNQSGQALLIIVLVMVVALTIGLSVASRTITNLRNTRDQASSQKALSAAEAGVEQAIKNGANVAGSFSGNTTYTTTIGQVLGTSIILNGGSAIPKNDAIYVWLYDATGAPPATGPWSGSLTIYWGNTSGAPNNAALEISVISGTNANPVMKRYGFDPYASRVSSNRFTNVAASVNTVSGVNFSYKTTISITNGFLLRVDPIYTSTIVGAVGSVALPSQGKTITSTGTSDSTTQRKVTVYQGYPEIPAEFFPYTLFRP